MKKLLFILLLISSSIYAQTDTGEEQVFDYGIKNNAAQTVTSATYITTTSATGTQGKMLPANLPVSTQTQIAIDGKVSDTIRNGINSIAPSENAVYDALQEVDLQSSYDKGNTITTSTGLGAVALKRGSAADTDNVLVVQNGAGTNTFSVTGSGNITGGTYNGYVPALKNSIYYRGKDIEFFGDSYTSGSGSSVSANRWTSIISRVLGATEINHGVAGTTLMKRTPIDYMASPNMVDNVVNIPTKTASKAMLVFAFGLNDMGQTAADYTTVNYKTDYQFVLNNAYSKGWLPSQILIIPAYYIGSAGYAAYATLTGNAAPTEVRHLSFIQAAKEIALLNETMYFDIYQDQKKNNTTLLDPDNIHPNDAGYAYIANDVLHYLGQDKIGTTTNTTYDLKAGFIPNNNGSVFYNSLIYDSGARIGIGTISPQSTLHLNSLANTVDLRFTNSVTGSSNLDGTTLTVDLNGDYVINNYENKGIITATNNTIQNYVNNLGQTILGGMSASNTTDRLQVIGSARAQEWVSDNGSSGALYFGRNGATNLYVIGSDNALGGSINDVAYYSYSGNHKFYQPVFAPTATAGTNTTQIATTAFVQANKNKLAGYTVATLPAGTIGDMAYVTDASGFSYNSILVGGGSGVTIAFYDGTNWRAH